jgi:hypothetical protein
MTRKGRAITLSLKEPDKIALQTIADQLGYTWGDNPNISKLVEAIARQKLLIAPNHDWPKDLIAALQQAIITLIDSGDSENTQIISELLLKRSELTIPLRREIERLLETTRKPNWRQTLDRLIQRHQPFQLSYQDAAQRIWTFHIHFAHITPIERREYLECWCVETEGNTDLPELQHNWTLRLDRIPDAAIAPIKGSWRSDLESIPVEMHLFNGLAFAYHSKNNQDLENEWLPDRPQVRRVVRRVTSTFWFIREVLRYGQDCELISPDTLRDRLRQNLAATLQRYNPTP